MIFVIAEQKDNKLKPITFELLVFAQRLSRDFNQPVTAVVLGARVEPLADDSEDLLQWLITGEELPDRGADRIERVVDTAFQIK